MCGEPGARWAYCDALSTNFWPAQTFDRLFAYRGDTIGLCAACVWCARSLALRCCPFIARENGVWFVSRRRFLAALLDPPEPPFVAVYPRYGAEHGGESQGWRAPWPGCPRVEDLYPGAERADGSGPLTTAVHIQCKHAAVYAVIAEDRERYPLQIDDTVQIVVDVPRWRILARVAATIATELRQAGCGAGDVRDSLATLTPPPRAPLATVARWTALTCLLRPHVLSAWWPVLTDLLPMPEAPERPDTQPRPAAVSRGQKRVRR